LIYCILQPSPADEDTHGVINMGGYYTGTTSVYGSQIKSIWTDVSARHGRLEFRTVSAGSMSTALTLAHDNWASFGSSIDIGGGQITTPSGVNLALNPNTGTVTVGGILDVNGTGTSTFAGDIELAANLHSTGQNLKFHAAGTHVMNIDINGKVYPNTHNAYDLGHSASLAWRNIYSSGTIAANNISVAGTLSGVGAFVPSLVVVLSQVEYHIHIKNIVMYQYLIVMLGFTLLV
jgi:hypothetical protein